MASKPVRKAVIPAAGLGTRLLPATRSLPKEMVVLWDRPLIQYAIEEAVSSGITCIVLVINSRKQAIRDYFRPDPQLEVHLRERGKDAEADLVRRIPELCDIEFVEQEQPLGLGHAVGCASSVVGDEPFAVLLPDVVILNEVSCTRQLLECHQTRGGCVVAAREVDPQDVQRFGMMKLKPGSREAPPVLGVADFVEKPQLYHAPSLFGIFGRYVLAPEIFDAIARTQPDAHREIQLTSALALYAREHSAWGLLFQGRHFDVGDMAGLLEAGIALGLADTSIRPRLASWLRAAAAGEEAAANS